jgi:hypothetical protein
MSVPAAPSPSPSPRHRFVAVHDPQQGTNNCWLQGVDEELMVKPGEQVLAEAKLVFPSGTPSGYIAGRESALRAILRTERDEDKPAEQRWSTAFAHVFVLGFSQPAAEPGMIVTPWQFSLFKEDNLDPCQMGVMFLDTQNGEEGDRIEPLLLPNTAYGQGLLKAITYGIRMEQVRGIKNCPFRHLMSASYRTGCIQRRLYIARQATAAVPAAVAS